MDKNPNGDAKSNIRPDIPGLKSMEENKGASTANSGASQATAAGGVSQQLNNMEEKASKFAYNAAANTAGPVGRVIAAMGRHKTRSVAGGVGGITGIILTIVVIGGVADFALSDITHLLTGYEGKVEQTTEKKVAHSLLDHMLCRALGGNSVYSRAANCNKTGDEEDDASKAQEASEDAEVADTSENGNSFAKEVDSFDWNSQAVKQDLNGQGIEVDTTNGQLTGLTDSSTGKPITVNDINNDPALDNSFDAAMPEYEVEQMESLRPLMVEHAGEDFQALSDTDETSDEVQQDIEGDIINGADKSQIAKAESENQDENQSKNTNAQTQAEEASIVTDNNDILTTVEEDIAKGVPEAQAISDVEAQDIDLGSTATPSTVASDLCDVRDVATIASNNRVREIMDLAMRHFSTIASISGQAQTGHITSSEVSGTMKILQGNPSLLNNLTSNPKTPPSYTGTNESALPWDRSAAWMRISGNASSINSNPNASNYTPDIATSSEPKANTGTQIVHTVNQALAYTGGGLVCAVENSPFGTIGNFFLNSADFLSNIGSFGLSEAGTLALVTGAQQLLQRVLLPDIIQYFTPIGMAGGEYSTQWMNVADEGANLSFNDYSRSLGAEPISNSQADSQYADASNIQQASNNSQSFAYRTFALSNPESLLSQLVLKLPTSKMEIFSNMASYLTSIPREFGSLLSSIFTPKLLADSSSDPATDETPGVAYGITQYGFSNDTEYDPFQNEIFLSTIKMSFNGASGTLMQMLGDPLNFPNATPDPSTTDVLHCFTQGFDSTSSETSPDPICATLGNYDYCDNSANNPCAGNIGAQAPQQIEPGNVAVSFCDYLRNINPLNFNFGECLSTLTPQISADNVMDHFRQYIMDVHVMAGYTSLTNNQ